MSLARFVHLRVHTAYSLLEGAIHIADLAERCRAARMPAVAITDSANLFGALEFSETMAAAGVQPIIGVTLPVETPHGEPPRPGHPKPRPDALVLLVQNETGYRNLMALVSKAHLASEAHETPHIVLDDLAENGRSEGLIALTGGPDGPLGRLLRAGQSEKAEALLGELKALFPGRLYIEILRHGLPEEEETEAAFIDLAYVHALPLVATNQCFFPDADMYEAHDALLCIAEGAYVSETDRRRLTPEHRFKSADEMATLFADLPEAIDNTRVIARRCAFRPQPVAPILPKFPTEDGASEADLLRRMAEAGLARRLEAQVFAPGDDAAARAAKAKPYEERLAYELDIIVRMGFAGYFLIVADFIQWAKDHDIPVGPGRGSGAGSLVAWSLRITELDPLRFSLLFERFLNPERVSMPDFDIDFCQEKRERVIRYVQERYGRRHVAQIITFGSLQARAALRDVGRVMQQPYPVTDRLCKMIPNNPADPKTLAQALAEEPRLRQAQRDDPLTAAVIDRALKLEGLYRHASTHAAGVVIGDRPLEELVPLYRDPRSPMPVTQFHMKWVEQAGLVKFDFLGLKTLSVLDRALSTIRRRGIEIDLHAIPLDDPLTYAMLAEGDTVGVFQLESSGMRAVLKGLRPDSFEDIIAIVALYRPGPMDNIPTYVARKHGEEEVVYPHPMIAKVLEETYGIAIYQEQVMQIAQEMAGYSLGEADLLRRAMGKKKPKEMEQQRARFIEGAKKRGVDAGRANEIFELLAKFAGYGFNKSHAAAYALVAYQTAYLKANFPVEFMAATMTFDMNNTDKLAQFKKELARMEIPLLAPDVNASEVAFTVERVSDPVPGDVRAGLGVRYALAAIKGVGEKAMEEVIREREANGPFRDLFDFAERVDPAHMNRRQFEQLAAAGAFDALEPNRARVFAAAETLMRHAHQAAEARHSQQESLFGEGNKLPQPPLPEVTPWTEAERLAREQAAIGFYLSAHPLDAYDRLLTRLRVKPAAAVLATGENGQTVRLAGVIDSFSERKARRSGKRFGVFQLSDPSGGFEVMVFSEGLAEARVLAEAGDPILAEVDVRATAEGDGVRLLARSLQSLERAAAQSDTGLEIELADGKALEVLHELLAPHRGGRGRISFRLPLGDGREALVDLPDGYRVTPPLKSAIATQHGVLDVAET